MDKAIVKKLAALGGGFFTRKRNIWSRIEELDEWKVFREPVEIWFEGGSINDDNVSEVLDVIRRVPDIKKIRFLGSAISDSAIIHLKKACPGAVIETKMSTTTPRSVRR